MLQKWYQVDPRLTAATVVKSLKWLTQEADAKNWPSPKHVQPEEGLKELLPRAIKFRESRVDTAI